MLGCCYLSTKHTTNTFMHFQHLQNEKFHSASSFDDFAMYILRVCPNTILITSTWRNFFSQIE